MENEGYDKPNPGCAKGETKGLLNIDPERYSYVDFFDDIHKLAMASGCSDGGSPLTLSFSYPNSQSKYPINTDSDVVSMFKLNIKCICIHVYVDLLNYEDNEIGVANSVKFIRDNNCELGEIAISESDNEWRMSDESQQEGGETNSDCSYIDEEKTKGMKGNLFDHEPAGEVKLEVGLLFADVNAFRAALRGFVIQEGFEIKKIRNEKTRVTAICAIIGCCWRIHASPTPDGQTYKIKTYNPVHSCIRTSKNSNATSTLIAKKLESNFKPTHFNPSNDFKPSHS